MREERAVVVVAAAGGGGGGGVGLTSIDVLNRKRRSHHGREEALTRRVIPTQHTGMGI
jgi:hypothetical protein